MFKGTRQNGRTPGVPNKANAIARQSFNDLLNGNLERIQKDLDECSAPVRLRFLIDLAAFCVPRLKSIEINDQSDKQRTQTLTIQMHNGKRSNNLEL
jgi:hypothetical protein